MKIDRICFEQLFPTGLYANQRFRAEASVEEGEDLTGCYKKLQQEVEKAFIAINPQISWSAGAQVYVNPEYSHLLNGNSETKTDPKEQQIEGFIQAIQMANGVKALKYFEKISETDPRIKEAYNNKLKSFE